MLPDVALNMIFNSIPIGIVMVEKQTGKICYVNNWVIQLCGGDLCGSDFLTSSKLMKMFTMDGEVYPFEKLPICRTLATGKESMGTVVIQRPDGSRAIISISAKPIMDEGEFVAVIGIFEGITQHEEVERVLLENEERLLLALKASRSMVYEMNPRTGQVYSMQGLRWLLGYDPSEVEMTLDWWDQQIHSEDLPHCRDILETTMRRPGNHKLEYRVRNRNGCWLFVEDNATVICGEFGKPLRIIGIVTDISERKKAEEDLKQSEERFFKAFINNPAAMTIMRLSDELLVDVNETFLDLTEYTREEVVGHKTNDLNIFDSNVKERAQLLDDLKNNGSLYSIELNARTKSGKHLKLLFSGVTIDVEGQNYVISMMINITDRKKAEEALMYARLELEDYSIHLENLVEERTKQLKDAEMLSAIGATAGMVGHDIRNPLQSIDGAVYLAKQELKSLPEKSAEREVLHEILNVIQEQTHYIDHIVADLQDFAKKPIPKLEETDIEDLIIETLSNVKIPNTIEVHTVFQKDLGKLMTDPTLIKRVVTNLIINAIQAMPDGGDLIIRVFFKEESVWITIEDTGIGISQENRSKIFMPLFTTKAKGQGFGLAVCKKLIKAQGGEISFKSEEGKGTIFTINLPVQKET